MFGLHEKDTAHRSGHSADAPPSWRPNVPERKVNLGRTWYGRRRKPAPLKANPKGGYDRFAGYDAPAADGDRPRQRVDLAISAFVLGSAAMLLAWWPILKYIGVGFALLAILVATRELARHDPASRAMMKGEAAHAERFARTGRVIAVLAIAVVAGNLLWALKTGKDDHAKASGHDTGSVLDDVGVSFGEFSTGINGIGQPTRQLSVTVKNRTSRTHSFQIQIEAIDPSTHERIASDELLEQSMKAGEIREQAAFQFADPTQTEALQRATFRVAQATER